MALVAALGVALLLLWRRVDPTRLRRGIEAAGVAAVVAGAVLVVPVAYKFGGPAAVYGDFHGPGFYVSDLFGFVLPTSTLAVYPPFLVALSSRFAGGPTENTAYLGLPLLALLAYTAWRWRGVLLVRWSAALLTLTAVLSLGPLLQAGGRVLTIPLPWLVLQFVPLYGDVLTSRLMAYVYLLAAVLLAWFIAHLDGLAPRRRLLAWALVGLVALSLLPRPRWHPTGATSPPFSRAPASPPSRAARCWWLPSQPTPGSSITARSRCRTRCSGRPLRGCASRCPRAMPGRRARRGTRARPEAEPHPGAAGPGRRRRRDSQPLPGGP